MYVYSAIYSSSYNYNIYSTKAAERVVYNYVGLSNFTILYKYV